MKREEKVSNIILRKIYVLQSKYRDSDIFTSITLGYYDYIDFIQENIWNYFFNDKDFCGLPIKQIRRKRYISVNLKKEVRNRHEKEIQFLHQMPPS